MVEVVGEVEVLEVVLEVVEMEASVDLLQATVLQATVLQAAALALVQLAAMHPKTHHAGTR